MLDEIKEFIKDWDVEKSFYVYQVDNCLSIVVDKDELHYSRHTKWAYWALINFLVSNCIKCWGNCYFFEHEKVYLVV